MHYVYNHLNLTSVEPQVGRTLGLHGLDRIFLDISHACSLTCMGLQYALQAGRVGEGELNYISAEPRGKVNLWAAQFASEWGVEPNWSNAKHSEKNPAIRAHLICLWLSHITNLYRLHYIYSFGRCFHEMWRNNSFAQGPNSGSLGIWVTTSCLLFST